MLIVGLTILALACLTAVFKWHWALLICVVVALLQDPLRKITPGAPVVYVGFVMIAFAAAYVGAAAARVRLSPSVIHGWRQNMRLPSTLFVAILGLQAALSYVRFDNVMLLALGAAFYVTPALGVVFAHQLACRTGTQGVARWMWFYVACSLVWLMSVYAEAIGIRAPMLGEVGLGQIIYDVGGASKANAGFYRAAEIAAWHVATVSCFLFILLNGRKLSVTKSLIVVLVVVFLLYVGLATGRRKMLVQVVAFASTYLFLHAWFLRGKAKLAVLFVVAGVMLFGTVLATVKPDAGDLDAAARREQPASDDPLIAWKDRGLTVFAAVPARLLQTGFLPVMSAVGDFGVFGAGLGAGAQGAQHFGGGARLVGGSAEGGLGKLTLDLGLPGLMVALWLIVTVGRMIWTRLRVLANASRPHASVAFGLVGVLVANAATFSLATQAYGDLFILLTLGTCVGILLALPAMAARDLGIAGNPPAQSNVAVAHRHSAWMRH